VTVSQPQAEVLLAIQTAKDELTRLVNEVLASIQASLAVMQREHSTALLEQAKLNGTFADRDSLNALASRVDSHDGKLTDYHRVATEAIEDRKNLRQELSSLSSHVANARTSDLQERLDWIVGGIVAVLAAVGGYAVAHLIH